MRHARQRDRADGTRLSGRTRPGRWRRGQGGASCGQDGEAGRAIGAREAWPGQPLLPAAQHCLIRVSCGGRTRKLTALQPPGSSSPCTTSALAAPPLVSQATPGGQTSPDLSSMARGLRTLLRNRLTLNDLNLCVHGPRALRRWQAERENVSSPRQGRRHRAQREPLRNQRRSVSIGDGGMQLRAGKFEGRRWFSSDHHLGQALSCPNTHQHRHRLSLSLTLSLPPSCPQSDDE